MPVWGCQFSYTPVTDKTLGQAQIDNAAPTTLYTVPAGKRAAVLDLNIANTTATAATISVWADPDGTGVADGNALMKTYSIPANDFYRWTGRVILEAGATLKAQAGSATAITITASGWESL